MDTAKNVLDYVETIHRLLKPGGVWVNIGMLATVYTDCGRSSPRLTHRVPGPLLYHWAEVPGELSIELSWDELRRVILSFGFVIEVPPRRLLSPRRLALI
jgi:carnosine N-methyltransferase